jgi:tRNA(Arg) A34 adenosine deaminase TadA
MQTTSEWAMNRAVDLAVENVRSGAGGPFGALIVRNEYIIAEGVNRVTSLNDPTAHAEIEAIREACRRLGRFHLEDCEIYASCEPCPMCLGAIYWARLSQLWFGATRADAEEAGFSDAHIYEEVNTPLSGRRIPSVQLMRDNALRAFAEWRRSEHRVDY